MEPNVKKNDLPLHVFLVSNPIVAMVSYEYIHEMSLKKDDILIIFFRDFYVNLFSEMNIRICNRSILQKLGDRLSVSDINTRTSNKDIFEKIGDHFSVTKLSSRSVKRKLIESYNRQFILYTSWLDETASEVVESKDCRGHVYIEEGDMSYQEHPIFPLSIDYCRQSKRIVGKNEFFTDFWRNDALLWVGVTKNSFPTAPDSKKYKIRSFLNAKKKYNPVLQEYKNILLMPSPARLPESEWKNSVSKLASNENQPFALKLHPRMIGRNPLVFKYFENVLHELGFSEAIVCSKETIIEIEMMYDKKKLVGDRSSLSRYADLVGSDFEEVPFLYGEFYGHKRE